MAIKEPITKIYEDALSKKDGPVWNAAIKRPETPGPMRRPALKFAEFRLTAFARSLFPTISDVNA